MNKSHLRRLFALSAFPAMIAIVALSACSAKPPPPPDVNLGFDYVRRGAEIHHLGGSKTGTGRNATRIDKPSLFNVKGFSRSLPGPVTPCRAPDAATFEPLSEEYARDKNKAYYKWISPGRFLVIELPNADAKSLEVLGFNLARDKNRVWWYGAEIPGIDAAEVEVVDDGRVWKDGKNVWYQHQRLAGADAPSFRHLGSAYYKDNKRAYWSSTPIAGADLASIKVLGDSFVAVDNKMVYASGRTLPSIDPASCKFILQAPYGYHVISDKNGVYLSGLKFLHADPEDFSMIDKLTAKGGQHVFLVDTWHSTPVTVYREAGDIIAATVLYEKSSREPLALIKATLIGDKLENVILLPPPGKTTAKPVPDWQRKLFIRPDMAKRVKAAVSHLP